jgi:hypothetical protein
MPRPPNVRPLPEAERRQVLSQFLEFLGRQPELAHFRTLVPAGKERQLALLAALERAVFRGNAAVCPPAADDVADQLLCDIIEAIDGDPRLAHHGSAYGAHRHRINLQALGAWSGRPAALEFFTTAFSHLSAGAANTSPALATNSSPVPQEFGPSGELVSVDPPQNPEDSRPGPGILHHAGETSGDQCGSAALSLPAMGLTVAAPDQTATDVRGFENLSRPVRRGRPPALDERAKGRLLGLMAHGLSFRQAAAQLGVHHVTLLNALKRDEELAQQVAEARLDAIAQPLVVIVQAARKNWRAAAWLAKFLEERRTHGIETTPEERELARKRA